MHDSKLLTLLRGLQQEEIHWFQKFLKSPFYNTNPLFIDLFDYIRKYYPDLRSPRLSKEVTCQKLFPKEKANFQKLRKLMHGLATLTEEFLVAQRLRNNQFEKKKLLVTELGERNVYGLFEKGTKGLISGLEELPYRDVNYYKEVHELKLNYYDHLQTEKNQKSLSELKKSIDHLDYFYLVQKQRLEFAAMWHGKLVGTKPQINTLSQARTEIFSEPVFKMYALIVEAFNHRDGDSVFEELEVLYKKEINKLGRSDQIAISRILLNYKGGQINKGIKDGHTKLMSLYKFGLEKGLFIENKQMSESIFSNIASLGVGIGEFNWVEQFISENQQFLPDSKREDVVGISFGLLFYYKEEYDKTIELILNRSFVNPLNILRSKSIMLRAYFEKFILNDTYYDFLIAQTNAFEKYVRRNELVSKERKEMYLNFIIFTRKISNLFFQKSSDHGLTQKIKTTKPLILRNWLLEKTQMLVSKKT